MTFVRRLARGVGMIEVLVALVIIAVGLLGLAGAQLQAQKAEIESYQRTQALLLLEDIASRIRANRTTAHCYETDSYVGHGADPDDCAGWGTSATRALADRDMDDWDALLEGQAEMLDGDSVGAMTQARGCVTYDPTEEDFTVTVVWQGEVVTEEPASGCAAGEYGDDGLRRAVSTQLTIPDLD
ncbi:MAG: type IV pilus modification protein PilV [Halofilum sp. (in: g-proteobacteria)]